MATEVLCTFYNVLRTIFTGGYVATLNIYYWRSVQVLTHSLLLTDERIWVGLSFFEVNRELLIWLFIFTFFKFAFDAA